MSEDTPLPRLSVNALPTEPFRKWVRSVLSTTQVTQNVILLALMFVYRLKMTNPSVRGRPGSEYRLLTVALMLGNKCEFLFYLVAQRTHVDTTFSLGRQHVYK